MATVGRISAELATRSCISAAADVEVFLLVDVMLVSVP